ncbi:hypothetical protein [Tateyamaria pelophila]|uniref:hypothetical protein n=1 Tax=Tateyamaria pelophila TaxID=328415 RepID=UPI001CBD6A76|nr:hypothetical protein [Tateyamaria pelophila]
MSDHSNLNLHRGDGVSRRGVIVALVVVLGIVVLLAMGGTGDGTAPAGDVIAPVAETAPVATE